MQRAIGNGKVVADAGDLAAECGDDGHFGGANFELPPDHGLCLKMKFVQVQRIASIVLPLDATTQVEEFLREFRVRREANNVTEDGAMTGCVFLFAHSLILHAACLIVATGCTIWLMHRHCHVLQRTLFLPLPLLSMTVTNPALLRELLLLLFRRKIKGSELGMQNKKNSLECLLNPNWPIPGFSKWWSNRIKRFLHVSSCNLTFCFYLLPTHVTQEIRADCFWTFHQPVVAHTDMATG